MKVAVVYESRTGNTAELADLIGAAVQELGHEVGVFNTSKLNLDYLTDVDMVFLGTWTDGVIIAGHRPGDAGKLLDMPGIWGKPTAGFVTYALHAGNVVDKVGDVVTLLGGDWLGGRAFRRDKKTEGLAHYVIAALDAAEERLGVSG
ncbi:MAG: flavodoxin family protein [Actinomycetota bacterium]